MILFCRATDDFGGVEVYILHCIVQPRARASGQRSQPPRPLAILQEGIAHVWELIVEKNFDPAKSVVLMVASLKIDYTMIYHRSSFGLDKPMISCENQTVSRYYGHLWLIAKRGKTTIQDDFHCAAQVNCDLSPRLNSDLSPVVSQCLLVGCIWLGTNDHQWRLIGAAHYQVTPASLSFGVTVTLSDITVIPSTGV